MTFPRRRWLILLAIVALVALAHRWWLDGIGELLVKNEPPRRADVIVVLAGDDRGDRILRAAELVKQGYAPKVLVTGPECCYGNHESDLAIPFAVRHGYPAEWFIPLPMRADSTREEAQRALEEMKRRNLRTFLLVTSDYHTRRAARVYASLVPRDRFRTVAATAHSRIAEGWWRTRDGQRQVVIEWMKTIVYWFEV